MPDPLLVHVLEEGRLMFEAPLAGALELGRQRQEEDAVPLYRVPPTTGGRVVVAPRQENNVGRHHLRLEPLPSGTVRVRNGSQIPLVVTPGPLIAPGTEQDVQPPFTVSLPRRSILVGPPGCGPELRLRGLDQKTLPPGTLVAGAAPLRLLPSGIDLDNLGDLIGWLHTTMGVLQSTVGSADFLDRAAQALVEIVGLASGRVLLLRGGNWEVAALRGATADAPGDWLPSPLVLDRVGRERRTCWQPLSSVCPEGAPGPTVVAAPLLDGRGEVVGALYGEQRGGAGAHETGRIEALLVDLLACGVSAGLARQQHERAALKAQVQMEQFFTPRLAEQLRRNEHLLDGHEAEVTVLFGDIRGFSRVSERLGPAVTLAWINDAMTELSRCVLDEDGVLVDYIGDELMAMWGAPEVQPDHALRAVRAALAMRQALEELNARWTERLGEPMSLGVGVNSGPAQVGNTGSRYKFKYGPLGNTVNLGSRLQGLTKYLKCRLLVSAATRQHLADGFLSRRVVRTRVMNIQQPVEVYELEAGADEATHLFFTASEEALDALEQGEFARAAKLAGALLLEHPTDGPLRLLLSRATQMLLLDGEGFDPVWTPPGK